VKKEERKKEEGGKKRLSAPAARLLWQILTQRTQRRRGRKVVVRGHSGVPSREDWLEGRGGGEEGVVVRRIIVVLSRFILFNENQAYDNPFFLFPLCSLRLGVLCEKIFQRIAPQAPATSS